MRGGHGSSPRLADAFCGLAPDPDRRSGILAMARNEIEQDGAAVDPALAQAWRQIRRAAHRLLRQGLRVGRVQRRTGAPQRARRWTSTRTTPIPPRSRPGGAQRWTTTACGCSTQNSSPIS
ncbi:MAG: hypothetical protein MZU95_14670 [Desulfomicrobium escambiense]|nr:hypothetical protein [Desulfomicrobium escambiense]